MIDNKQPIEFSDKELPFTLGVERISGKDIKKDLEALSREAFNEFESLDYRDHELREKKQVEIVVRGSNLRLGYEKFSHLLSTNKYTIK
jgi:hypothetical protein